jgi:hypothetical protein
MECPARYASCIGLHAFSLPAFLGSAVPARRYKCPVCPAAGPTDGLKRDTYLAAAVRPVNVILGLSPGKVYAVGVG